MTLRSTLLVVLTTLSGLACSFVLAWKEMKDRDEQKEAPEHPIVAPEEIFTPVEVLALDTFDTHKPLWSHYVAGSRLDWEAIRKFGRENVCFNKPIKLDARREGVAGKLTLHANVERPVAWGKYRGFEVLVVNRTGTEVTLSVDSSRVPIVMEATNSEGKWQPIEFVPAPICGNSISRVFLPNEHCWRFAAPVYRGTLKCKQRFVLKTRAPIYSEEFDGMVNPEQFLTSSDINMNWISEDMEIVSKVELD